jgi:predicted enzyme related to lactoylglutathione lyase
MATQLKYVIKFVADMDAAIAFHRDVLGLSVRFATPFWSELDTGETTLALHPASAENPAGTVQVGFGVDDVDAFHVEKAAAGVDFIKPPADLHGVRLAALRDSEGAEIRVSGPVRS